MVVDDGAKRWTAPRQLLMEARRTVWRMAEADGVSTGGLLQPRCWTQRVLETASPRAQPLSAPTSGRRYKHTPAPPAYTAPPTSTGVEP